MIRLMRVYYGFSRGRSKLYEVEIITDDIGQISCLECNGSGRWDYGPTDEEDELCIPCKGTGKVYISI